MNKTFLLALILPLLLFSSCQQAGTDSTSKAKEASAIDSLKTKGETPLVAENYASNNYAEIGWELMKKEGFGALKLGMVSTNLMQLLGPPDSTSAEVYWGADGAYHSDWIYTEKGIRLGLSRIGDDSSEKSLKMMDRISIYAPCELTTARGIGVNASIAEVKQAYQKAIESTELQDNYLVAGSVYGGLVFKFKNDRVEELFLGARAE